MYTGNKSNSLSFHHNQGKKLIVSTVKRSHFSSLNLAVLLFNFIFIFGLTTAYSQTVYQPNYFTGNQPTNNNYMANSTAFKQEVARMEINVSREGREPLPITQVPRLEKNDVLKVHLLEEQVNGMKLDQSNWDWTFLVAYVNPARNNEKEKLVSEEIQFRKSGWYKEYTFTVPYDSQPIFFLYTKPKYRDKVLNLISKNQEEIRKIGEKTIELSSAYAQIGSFLNELQYVMNRYQYAGSYGTNNYNTYGTYGSYYPYGTTTTGTPPTLGGFNQSLFMEQTIERLARSFNIQLPSCWQNGSNGSYGNYNGYNNYGTYNNNTYNNGTYNNGYSNYGTYNNGYNSYGSGLYGNDFIGRAQCVAKSVRVEDFDLSVSRLLQQGGILAAAQLTQKYPQIAFWINVAAAALDFIIKVTKKTPLRIVPTVISTTDNPAQGLGFQQNYAVQQNTTMYQNTNSMTPGVSSPTTPPVAGAVKISLFAESPPNDSNFVTAYPLVIHKWQANPDPAVIGLPIPALSDQCLHAGQNILKSTDLLTDWMADNFTKDFKLVISAQNGFRKEFPLKKNLGMGGWELNITKEELSSFPKISMALESEITGKRGFNLIKSPKFNLPIPVGGTWEVDPESQKSLTVGGKRKVVLRNQLGSCKCLQTVTYKPSFGGQFVFDVNSKENNLAFSEDGKEVSFVIDATTFQAGQGQLELKQTGGEVSNLNLSIYAPTPNITDVKISRGDNQAIVVGDRLDQVRAIKINGKRAIATDGSSTSVTNTAQNSPIQNSAPQNSYPATQGNTVPMSSGNMSGNTANNQYNYPAVSQTNSAASNTNPGNNSNPVQYNYDYSTNNQNNKVSTPINNQTAPSNPYQANTQVSNQTVYPNASQNSNTNPQTTMATTPNNYQYDYSANSPNSVPNNIQNSVQNNVSSYPVATSSTPSTASNEKVFVFEQSDARQDSNTISLELELEGNRNYSYPRTFNVSLARPTIVLNNSKEVEGVATVVKNKSLLNLSNLPIFQIDTAEISANIQNALTDYDFKVENIQIETRIENSQINSAEMPKANFEVLDWKNMQITFVLNEQTQRLLGGRRLQFRIRDRMRGDSDWYTLHSTFVRLPEIKTVKCTKEMNANCEMKGVGIEYISQVSVDGGKSWYPQEPATLTVQSTADGQKAAMIPRFSNKKLLQIKLRDYKTNEGLIPNEFNLLNTLGR